MSKDYWQLIMYTSPSEEFPLQEEGQTCCASGESCFAWLCGGIVWLCLHGDKGMGPILPRVLAITVWDFTEIVQTGHLVGTTVEENQKTGWFQEHPLSQGSIRRRRLLQSRQLTHYFLKQWITKCPWDMGVTCQEKYKCKLWKDQVVYPGSYC